MVHHQGIVGAGEVHVHAVDLVHPDASAADGYTLDRQLLPVGVLHGQNRGIGVGIPQLHGMDIKLQSPLLRDLKAPGDIQVIRTHAQKPSHQRFVRAMALSRLRKGAVQRNVRFDRLPAQKRARHVPDPYRSRRVGAGRPDHHRPQNVENIQHLLRSFPRLSAHGRHFSYN